MSKPRIVCVMGPTCVGKTSILNYAKQGGDQGPRPTVACVEVGKQLRAKYPPEYFQGKNNPTHTAKEAWELCESGVKAAIAEGIDLILVDGQPRDLPQIHLMNTCFGSTPIHYFLITASPEVCAKRAEISRGNNPANLELARQRNVNDRLSHYEVMAELLRLGKAIDVFDTSGYGLDQADECCKAAYHRLLTYFY